MKAAFLDYDTVSNGDLDTASLSQVLPELQFLAHTDDANIEARLGDLRIALINKCALTRERLERAAQLRLVAVAGTGTDQVDLAAARELNIGVCNVPAYCVESVTQHVWAFILSLTHRLSDYGRIARTGGWGCTDTFAANAGPIRELSGLTLGIIGWGALGSATAAVAPAFGMRVIVANRPGGERQPGRHDLDEVLRTADIVSLHCPLNEATRGMIGARELALMKRDALLINTARGGLVDSRALAAALAQGRLGGAGIDVLPHEPPDGGEPLLDAGLPNLLLTPHVAWGAREARQRCLEEMAANVRAFLNGGHRARVV